MKACHGLTDAVESQHPCAVVKVDPYPWRMWGTDGFVHPVMPGRIARVGAEETPGFIVVPQQAQGTLAFAADASVGHPNRKFSIPLYLPIEAATRQSLTAQHLCKGVEPLCIIRVGLQVAGSSHLLVSI